ncbi:MAG: hypothetical protein Q7U47_09180 [Paludibacter sp.]|nr:hypothetical protein [Paludibacter sp.]
MSNSFLFTMIMFWGVPHAACGSPDKNSCLLQDSGKDNTATVKFEKIPVHGLPKYTDVQWVVAKTGLTVYCENFGIDQLEKDLMFAKTGAYPFNEFKLLKFKNGSNKKFIDVFPEKKLQLFWETSRQVLRDYNKNGKNR